MLNIFCMPSHKKYLIGRLGGFTRACVLGAWHGYFVALVSNGAIDIQVYLHLICWNLADRIYLFWNRHLALLSQGEISPLGQSQPLTANLRITGI